MKLSFGLTARTALLVLLLNSSGTQVRAAQLPPGHVNSSFSAASSAASVDKTLDEIERSLDKTSVSDDMLKQIQRVLEANPKNARAHYLAGRIFDRAGYSELSEQEFATADQLDPSKPQAVLELFSAKIDRGDYAGAWDYLRYVKNRFPDDPALLLMQGLYMQGQKNDVEAEKLFSRALQSPKRFPGIATALAETRIRQHRYAEAFKLAKEDIDAQPNHWRAQAVCGEALIQLGHSAEGLDCMRKAFELHPLDKQFCEVFATNLYNNGRYSEALVPMLIVLAQTTDQQELRHVKHECAVLLPHIPKHEVVNSINIAQAKLDKTPFVSRLHLAFGDVLDMQGWHDLAIAEYGRGVQLDPNVGRGYFRLARDYEKTGHYQEAADLYGKAYRMEPGDLQVMFCAARFAQRMQNRDNDVAWALKDWLRGRGNGSAVKPGGK